MDINTTKETLKVNRIVCERKETINVQGDMIVPDSKPDILSTINTTGNVCIYKKDVMEGKVRLDGNILTYIMYLADGEADNVRGLSTGLDFSETINIPELELGMDVAISTSIKFIECKILNGRKIGIKVTLDVSLKVSSKEEAEIVTDMNNQDIQVLRQLMNVNSIIGEESTKANVKENISIPSTDNLVEILNAQMCLVDKDIKISYNKIIAKSDVEVKLVYLTEDGRICVSQNRLPLVGFIDMPDVKEENICETTFMLRNILIKPNSMEDHTVYIELEVEIFCTTYEEREIQVIKDMYCPGEKMQFDTCMLNTMTNKSRQKNLCEIKENINVPELAEGEIIDVTVEPTITKENRLNNKIIFEGELELNLLFTDKSSVGVNTKKFTIPFEQTVDNIEISENCKINSQIEIAKKEFTNNAGTMNVNIDLNFETSTSQNLAIPVINNITAVEEDFLEDYSVIIYVVRSGDTLWKIAKRFGSTVDDIVRVNGIERPDKINVGEKIYIPKYVLKRAKEPITLKQNV